METLQKEEKKLQEATKWIKQWAKQQAEVAGTKLDWIDLKYVEEGTLKHNSKGEHKLTPVVSDLKYNDQLIRKLARDDQGRKEITTKVVNEDTQAAQLALNFTESVSKTVSHAVTWGLDITLSLTATAGFFEVGLETGLNLSSTETKERQVSFSFNPGTTIPVKGQHEAQVVAYLYPIPEIHPFEVDVTVAGEVPIRFRKPVEYDSITHQFKKPMLGGEKLHFIPIAHIFNDLFLQQKKSGIDPDFTINPHEGMVRFKVKGESKIINYVAETKIVKQVPLPNLKLNNADQSSVESIPMSEEARFFETKRFMAGVTQNGGVTLKEVTEAVGELDVEALCNLLIKIGEGMSKAFININHDDVKQAIDVAGRTHVDDLKEVRESLPPQGGSFEIRLQSR